MKECTFELNGKPMSNFKVDSSSFPAFSGIGDHINRRISACVLNQGPIPPGEYFILNRESGGRLGWLRDLFNDKRDWFALYANDDEIDDETWCEQVKRGQFRLHPKGRMGISQGCIVIEHSKDFQSLSAMLKNSEPRTITGTEIRALGKVTVK